MGNISAVGNISATGNVSAANVQATTNITSTGTLTVAGQMWAGAFHSNGVLNNSGNCSFVNGNITVEYLGVRYYAWGTGAGAHTVFAFLWYYPYWATVNICIDNSVWHGVEPISDERVKQDIAPSELDCLAAAEVVPIYQFRWMDQSKPSEPKPVEPTDDNLIPIGLVAQRTWQVAPYLVMKPKDVPDSPWAQQPNQMAMWNIEHNNMFAMLVGALQQLSARLAELEARHGH